jgi:hypothetical protein
MRKASYYCWYDECMEPTHEGVVVILKIPDKNGLQHARFCCASHAAAALWRLAKDRGETSAALPTELDGLLAFLALLRAPSSPLGPPSPSP